MNLSGAAAPKPPRYAEGTLVGPYIVLSYLGRRQIENASFFRTEHVYGIKCENCETLYEYTQQRLRQAYKSKSCPNCRGLEKKEAKAQKPVHVPGWGSTLGDMK